MQVKVINVEPTTNSGKTKALATIQIPNLCKIYGIKVLQGDRALYCTTPTQTIYEDGIKKWTPLIVFDRPIWDKIQEEILKIYKEGERGDKTV